MSNGNMYIYSYQSVSSIFSEIKMQCKCVAFPCKGYIFMKDKAPWHWSKSTQHYITERGVNEFGLPGNSVDLTPIE